MKNSLHVSSTAQKEVDVENRIPLRYYYRFAGNLLNQATVYREENNIVDLYNLLIRFSSLVSETIPQHQDYPTYAAKEKANYKKRLRDVVDELKALKPEVQKQVGELNKTVASQRNKQGYDNEYHSSSKDKCGSWEWSPEVHPSYRSEKEHGSTGKVCTLQNDWEDDNRNWWSSSHQMKEQMNKLHVHVPEPSEETLSRHSFLRSSCHRGIWEPPLSHARVDYPGSNNITLIEIPSVEQVEEYTLSPGNFGDSHFGVNSAQVNVAGPLSTVDSSGSNAHVHIVRQPTPSPVLSCLQSVPAGENAHAHVSSFSVVDDLSQSTSPQHVQVSPKMIEDFLKLAKSNTEKNLETCGILAGSLMKRTFFVTTLIIPKQESTSDSCHTMNEEEIYAVQDERSLFPLGWIHTHPLQTCFMSSIDLHTQYSYQIMLPEAIAIVVAPTDSSRKYGIFRLSDPGGIMVLKQCQQRGFHPHKEPPDGSSIYDHCSNVLMNPNLKFDVVDIR